MENSFNINIYDQTALAESGQQFTSYTKTNGKKQNIIK